jgi:hypothetical protein
MRAPVNPRPQSQINLPLMAAEAVLHGQAQPQWVGGIKYNDK